MIKYYYLIIRKMKKVRKSDRIIIVNKELIEIFLTTFSSATDFSSRTPKNKIHT